MVGEGYRIFFFFYLKSVGLLVLFSKLVKTVRLIKMELFVKPWGLTEQICYFLNTGYLSWKRVYIVLDQELMLRCVFLRKLSFNLEICIN